MKRSERLSKIQMLLRQRGPMSLEQIRAELAVSSWTCFCDLSHLRDRFNLPIEMQRDTGRYYWVDGGRAGLRTAVTARPAQFPL